MAINFSRSASQIVGQYYVFMRNGFEGFREIHQRTMDVARYLAEQVEKTGLFRMYESATEIPIVCWTLADDANVDWTLYDLSDRLRMHGWQIPAYPMPENLQQVTVQRIVARADLSMALAMKFVADMKTEIENLSKATYTTGDTQGVVGGFDHSGR